MTYKVQQLTDEARVAWDEFVEASPKATFFHRSGWRKVLEESFGHRPCYHYVESDGRIYGALPLFHIRSLLFGNRLCSIPFCVAGYPLSNSAEIDKLLDQQAIGLLHQLGAKYIEYRDCDEVRPSWCAISDLYASFLGDLETTAELQLHRIPRKQRAVLRKALATKTLSVTIDESTEDLYELYALSVRNLGTPVFPRRYFQKLKQEFAREL